MSVAADQGAERRRAVAGIFKKIVKALLGLVILLLGYCGVFALRASFLDYPRVAGKMSQVKGAYHVHTTLSDGRATPEHIAKIAAAAGLQFVILTDHNRETLTPPRREAGVLLIFGTELSTPAGHLVALGLKSPLDKAARESDAVKKVIDQGALAFLAHPIQPKRPWTDWEASKLVTGFELYSADSMFRDAQRSPFSVFLPALGAYFAEPMQAFVTVSARQEEGTKKLLAHASGLDRPYIAMCAADAHGVPAYIHEFNALSIVLPANKTLSDDPVVAQTELLAMIAAGDTYCAFHGIAPADGFSVSARSVKVGEAITVALPAAKPEGARIEIFGPGTLEGDATVRATAEGAIQIEVWVDVPGRLFGTMRKPWIVASPIRVLPAAP